MKKGFFAAIALLLTSTCLVQAQSAVAPSADSSIWVSAEYLMWWFKNSPAPVPLVTTGDPTAAVGGLPVPGAIGGPSTQVLLGGSDIDTHGQSGGRFMAGYWADGAGTLGLEAGYLFSGEHSVTQSVASDGSTLLAVPFFNPLTHADEIGPLAGLPTAGLGTFAGGDALTLASSLQGAELNGVMNVDSCPSSRLDVLAGFRWLRLREDLSFATVSNDAPGVARDPLFFTPFTFTTHDEFDAHNNFYGGQLGVRAEYNWGHFFFNAAGKIGLGEVHETATINGNSTEIVGKVTVGFPGGVFAGPTNIGRYSRDQFAAVPEGSANVGFEFAQHARVFVGYTFLYISEVLRPGDEIDHTINPTRTGLATAGTTVPLDPARPAFDFRSSTFWAQGINAGLELHY
ncbi:MAG TPA: BBP7 family outer membrane beta-barrel protein [Gemmataceae bacterium]|jgi:hypothetical protein|nr:BBP7 family outer membrane beta-barrel protein [Gemmataceae bacterium]